MIDFKFTSNLDTINILPVELKLNEDVFKEIAHAVKENIKDKTPVRTGQLKNSIQSLASNNLATVWSDLFYAPMVNYGTNGRKANPFFLSLDGNVNEDTNNIVQKILDDKSFEQLFIS